MKVSIRPWQLVLAGIILNISAAVITHYFIKLNNQQITRLQQEANRFDTLIDSLWRQQTELQRQREFLLLLLASTNPQHHEEIFAIVHLRLTDSLNNLNLDSAEDQPLKPDITTVNAVTERARKALIGSINENYLEKLDVASRIEPLQAQNSLLFSVSIFLQMMGLILVVSKDIFD